LTCDLTEYATKNRSDETREKFDFPIPGLIPIPGIDFISVNRLIRLENYYYNVNLGKLIGCVWWIIVIIIIIIIKHI